MTWRLFSNSRRSKSGFGRVRPASKSNARVEINVRQQTPAPTMPIALLFVGVALPDQGGPADRKPAKSATNDPEDNLRKFIEAATVSRWDDLIAEHAFLIHAVKCRSSTTERVFRIRRTRLLIVAVQSDSPTNLSTCVQPGSSPWARCHSARDSEAPVGHSASRSGHI